MLTTRIPRDFKEFLKLLATHKARFLLIGGYAVNAFGYIRNTVDMDIWVAGDAENQKCVIAAIREFAFPGVTDDILTDPAAMLRMGLPPLRIEVMRAISGVQFEDCWERRVILQDEDSQIPMICLEDLKTNKKAAARAKDLVDLEELS